MNIAYSLLKMNKKIILFFFFILGLFYDEILIIFKNFILSNKNFFIFIFILLLKNMIHYFKHVYKAAMSIAKNASTVSNKIITAALVAGITAGAVSFGTILGENLAKNMTKNKLLFTMITMIPNQSNFNLFPYNLLPDMYLMSSCCIGLFIVILNILIVDHIKNINILSYLPNFIKSSKFFLIIEFFFNRYITIWTKSKKVILIISLIFIIINLFFIQLGLYIIIHHNPS
jgi:hypothetical protein